MTEFGAFVELEPGVDALLHVSQISKDHVEKPSDVLSKGQEVTAKIVDFSEENQKISLSVKALLALPRSGEPPKRLLKKLPQKKHLLPKNNRKKE